MQTKQTILVIGATGAQGGSVANALLQSGKYNVRALTRNINSEKAKALAAAGAELVKGDLEDKASLIEAMNGVCGVFGVTNFWEHHDQEFTHGKNLIEAVHQSGIDHFVFSVLENYHKASGGTLNVPHYDLKAKLKEYAKSLKLNASFVQLAYYYENFLAWFLPQKKDDGIYRFGFPQGNTKLAAVSVSDLGGVVLTIFNHPEVYIGRTVDVVGADMTCNEYAAIFSKILELDVRYNYIPLENYGGFADAEELGKMFEVQRLHFTDHQLALIESYGLNTEMQSFETWVKKNRLLLLEAMKEQLREAS